MRLFHLILIIKLLSTEFFCGSCQCTLERQCFNTTLDLSQTIYCQGYQSCAFSSITSQTSSLWYYGAASGYKAKALTISSQFFSNWALGYLSNALADTVLSGYEVYCRGTLSCLGISYLELKYTDAYVYCQGARSCAHIGKLTGTLSVTKMTIKGHSIFSFYNSSMYSNGYSVDLTLTSHYSGYGATLYCQNGDDCVVTCKGNSCFNFNFICDSGALCTVNCNNSGSIESVINKYDYKYEYNICPNGWNSSNDVYDSENDMKFMIELEKSVNITNYFIIPYYKELIEESKFLIKSEKCVIECMDAGTNGCDWNSSSLIIGGNDDNGAEDISRSICCYGVHSCAYRTNVTNSYINGRILCLGSLSCRNSSLAATNDVVALGDHAASFSQIVFGRVMISGGLFGAVRSTIKYGDILICEGLSSCQSTDIIGVKQIYGFGWHSLRYSSISSIKSQSRMDIYFIGYDSAADVTINCSENNSTVFNVYCGNGACKNIKEMNGTSCNIIFSVNLTFRYYDKTTPTPMETSTTISKTKTTTTSPGAKTTPGLQNTESPIDRDYFNFFTWLIRHACTRNDTK